ncbi:endoglycoceramidase [Actinocorallia herbida]|uniref:Endoglycoceramidase n=1 Tax=Actinocorallia herbida TaxID=58109 RepID=A0A3N1D1X7_9ACTN|nr:cellulase family glycosylhydrolase [Actinocorallia herbida]ROO87539.1 endoglycoceramidase [Actinocorallia herbida]
MRLRRMVMACALLTAVPAVPGTAAHAAQESSYITDEQGRVLILHGLNTASSAKGAGGLPWIGEADVARERELLGSNIVRYLIQWKNVEPEPGVYDEAYLDAVAERLRWYRGQGIHVVLDMHQDLYGPAACQGQGNGAPAWATITDGLSCTPQKPWFLSLLQPAVLRAYDNFWNHTGAHPELGERYTAMWRHVADRFKDDPAVLGYDLMNEPFGGSRQFGFFEGPVLTPFYQRIIDAIREVDDGTWIFVEPQAVGVGQGTPSSLGRLLGDRIALAPHFYPAALYVNRSYTGLTKSAVQAEFVAWRLSMTALSRDLGRPLWLGEVGAIGASVPGAADYTGDWLTFADDLRIGWAYWSNDTATDGTGIDTGVGPIDENGLTRIGRVMARPYPRAIAGLPVSIKATAVKFTLSWRSNGATGPTEIWLPPSFGADPKITSTASARWDPATRILLVDGTGGAVQTVAVG